MNGLLANQKPDGYFGPDKLRDSGNGYPDLWGQMLILDVLHSYYDHSGDARVIPFMQRYFAWQATLPDEAYKTGWAGVRWADNMAVLYWLYNVTGDQKLLDLSKRIHENSANYVDNLPTKHNVNLSQGIREPGEYWMQSGDPKHLNAVENDYQNIQANYGQFPGGGFAGDENIRPDFTDPRQGFETCGIVEYMHTHEMMTRISGDPLWADRAEELAFNSLPAALTPDQKGVHYITGANMVELNRKGTKGQFENDFPMLAYEPGANTYRCCPHNYGMGWAYYAGESWLATPDKGVAASLYTASDVKVKVGDGTLVTWSEDTDYPFKDTVNFKLATPKAVNFPFYLRIPRWAKNAQVSVNGQAVKVEATPLSYVVLDRNWKNGDTVSLRLPMEVSVKKWTKNKDSVSVSYGPLTFAYSPGEKWRQDGGTAEWPSYVVAPENAWNYGLPQDVTAADFQVVRRAGALSDQPFTPQSAPIMLQTKARLVPGWTTDWEEIARPLQQSPAFSTQPLQTILLYPMGAARLRVSSFPTVSTDSKALDWTLDAPKTPLYTLSASHEHNKIEAMIDGIDPQKSNDMSVPRFTWWDHRGTAEWAALAFRGQRTVSSASLYWFDDTGTGQCRVPASWKLSYKDGETWKPVQLIGTAGTARDQFNEVKFAPVTTMALRLDVQLQPNFSGGILEWKTDAK